MANQKTSVTITKDELIFAVFCIESIADRINAGGEEVYRLLTVDSKLLDEYIIPSYEPLHTQGKEYIVNDIIEFMEKEGILK